MAMAPSPNPISALGEVPPHDILVIGSMVTDISCTYERRPDDSEHAGPRYGSSNPAVITQTVGGTAHNIALAAHYLGASVLLTSFIAGDSAGDYLLNHVGSEGMSTSGIIRLESSDHYDTFRTGQYVGNYDSDKNLIFGMADVKLMLNQQAEQESLWDSLIQRCHPKIVVLDTTISKKTIDIITALAWQLGAVVVIDPVSQPRAEDLPRTQVFQSASAFMSQQRLDLFCPNAEELAALVRGTWSTGVVTYHKIQDETAEIRRRLHEAQNASISWQELEQVIINAVLILQYIPVLLVTLGHQGVLLAVRTNAQRRPSFTQPSETTHLLLPLSDRSQAFIHHFSAPQRLSSKEIVSVNGAGDSFVGAVIVALLSAIKDFSRPLRETRSETAEIMPLHLWREVIECGQWAALATLKSEKAVGTSLRDLGNFIRSMRAPQE